jgi:hypothetical protein
MNTVDTVPVVVCDDVSASCDDIMSMISDVLDETIVEGWSLSDVLEEVRGERGLR